jgi:hypothetical protein
MLCVCMYMYAFMSTYAPFQLQDHLADFYETWSGHDTLTSYF